MEKAYSTNDEEYNYETPGDALDALHSEGRLVEGEIYYEIDTQPVDLAEYLEADRILENAGEWAYDDIGEAAEGAFYASPEALAEWNAFTSAWAAKHLSTRCWKCVGKSTTLVVTADDVARYAP